MDWDSQQPLIGAGRADEVAELIDAVKSLIVPFVREADDNATIRATGGDPQATSQPANALIRGDLVPAKDLHQHLRDILPAGEGLGKDGLTAAISQILNFSVNTWDQGFLDKLYSSTNAVGVVTEMLLAALNTNLHVYSVSPALTIIEKITAKKLAGLFGFDGPHAGGVTISGGSASNMTSLVIARSTLYPNTKACGNGVYEFVLFTSEHGHYSVEKAAMTCGIGKSNVWLVPVDRAGRMIPARLAAMVQQARKQGFTPLYVNATAGSTVLGSYDPLEEISAICRAEGLWMHVDASWGGPVAFSSQHRHKLQGAHLANSVTVNPHKMMNTPVTCSFLLGPDMRVFHKANKTDADYLFHGDGGDDEEIYDLADLTLQCGRRGDSLKLALSWVYYGPNGFERQVDHAFEMAAFLATEIGTRDGFTLVSETPPPCLQVCFAYKATDVAEENTKRTAEMVRRLKGRGFMIDYAAFNGSRSDVPKGSFFRVVVNVQTRRETLIGLITALEAIGRDVESGS
ncbi:cysteine sulfinic acid decarboxylase [Diaporthe amygdali]|uniref:cysteine sulfinic acid decarboxylase n=1 Tax=Phomopsis amygdali TaxID=1214568 RepID=UPI0022FEC070|nr:cysteine sulfinic acid decarboxylase [Diaporthe amygdali]KAJ0114411.1 cysteine sulfinic acid decarboxylase [Diaporthe amygdali]